MLVLSSLKWLLISAIALTLVLLLIGQLGLLAGHRPAALGLKNGALRPPANTPNSVTSQIQANITPLRYQGAGEAALQRLKTLVSSMPGTTLITSQANYFHAEFQTPWLKFVDDVECVLGPEPGTIHIRSASRIGQKDFGVNRARVESIRAQFEISTGERNHD